MLKSKLDIEKRMDLEELKADIMALRKLYGLLEVNEDGFQNTALQNLDERSWLLLRNLLDGAAQKLFEQFIKCDQASASHTQSTPKPNPSQELTPPHSSTEAIHSAQNVKTRCEKYHPPDTHPSKCMNNSGDKLTEYAPKHPPQNCRSIKKRSLQYSGEKTPRKEDPALNHRGRRPPFYPEYIPAESTNSVSSSYESYEGSLASPFSPTSFSGRSCGSADGEDSITSNSESYSESIDSFSRSGGRRSSGSSRERRNGVVWGRKSGFRVGKSRSRSRRSSYHTYSRFLKKPFGRLRKLRNKLALVFHHHHHHHHHHGSVEGDKAQRLKEKLEGKEVVRVEERKKGEAVRRKQKGGKKKTNFGALVEGLKQHVRHSKKKKKFPRLKQPKMEKGNGLSRDLRWWKMFHKRTGRGGGRALEKRMRHGLLLENDSF